MLQLVNGLPAHARRLGPPSDRGFALSTTSTSPSAPARRKPLRGAQGTKRKPRKGEVNETADDRTGVRHGSGHPAVLFAQPADPLWARSTPPWAPPARTWPRRRPPLGWPRRDLHVQVGEVAVEPALALGSWGPSSKQGNRHGDGDGRPGVSKRSSPGRHRAPGRRHRRSRPSTTT